MDILIVISVLLFTLYSKMLFSYITENVVFIYNNKVLVKIKMLTRIRTKKLYNEKIIKNKVIIDQDSINLKMEGYNLVGSKKLQSYSCMFSWFTEIIYLNYIK